MAVKNIFMKMLKVMVVIGLIVSNIRLIYYIDSTIDPLMTYEYSDPVICSVICMGIKLMHSLCIICESKLE